MEHNEEKMVPSKRYCWRVEKGGKLVWPDQLFIALYEGESASAARFFLREHFDPRRTQEYQEMINTNNLANLVLCEVETRRYTE